MMPKRVSVIWLATTKDIFSLIMAKLSHVKTVFIRTHIEAATQKNKIERIFFLGVRIFVRPTPLNQGVAKIYFIWLASFFSLKLNYSLNFLEAFMKSFLGLIIESFVFFPKMFSKFYFKNYSTNTCESIHQSFLLRVFQPKIPNNLDRFVFLANFYVLSASNRSPFFHKSFFCIWTGIIYKHGGHLIEDQTWQVPWSCQGDANWSLWSPRKICLGRSWVISGMGWPNEGDFSDQRRIGTGWCWGWGSVWGANCRSLLYVQATSWNWCPVMCPK